MTQTSSSHWPQRAIAPALLLAIVASMTAPLLADRRRKTFSRKMAVLGSPEQFERAGFCALGSQNSGLQVQTFTSFEGATTWLTSEGPDV